MTGVLRRRIRKKAKLAGRVKRRDVGGAVLLFSHQRECGVKVDYLSNMSDHARVSQLKDRLACSVGWAGARECGSEELDAQGVLLPEDLRLALLDEHLKSLDHELAVEPVKVYAWSVSFSRPGYSVAWGVNLPVPRHVSPSVSSYTVRTMPRCAVSSTQRSTLAAHSSGRFQ